MSCNEAALNTAVGVLYSGANAPGGTLPTLWVITAVLCLSTPARRCCLMMSLWAPRLPRDGSGNSVARRDRGSVERQPAELPPDIVFFNDAFESAQLTHM